MGSLSLEAIDVELAGGAARVWRCGPERGAPVLLLHGVPTSGRLWGGVARQLAAAGHRVWCPDLPGYGGSDRIADLSVAGHADWLRDLVDALGLARAGLHLMGQDLGGPVAAEHAARHGATSLCLISTALCWGWLPARITALPGLQRIFYEARGGRFWLQHGTGPEVRAAFLAEHLPGVEATPDLGSFMRATAMALGPARLRHLPARLREAAVPVLCLWGAEDRFFPPWVARRIKAGLPGAQVEILPGGRHYLPADQPEALAHSWLRWSATWTAPGRGDSPRP